MSDETTSIELADSDLRIMSCFPVLKELRPHLHQDTFLAQMLDLKASDRYQLAYLSLDDSGEVVTVAGFTICTNLAYGRHLYLHDLVTADKHRSKGYGTVMLNWLKEYAREQTCSSLHLCSKTERKDAHRFYEREGMPIFAYYFVANIEKDDSSSKADT